MSVSSCSLDDSEQFLLRWCEDALSPVREEWVQVCRTGQSEAVIYSTLRLVEKTDVYLIGKYSTETGIVQSCRSSGGNFTVTILINQQGPTPPGVDLDPGVLLIDSFLTEEQESRILDEVDKEIQRQQFRSLAGAKAYLNTRLSNRRCEGTAVLNRLIKFTARSSTALVSNSVVHFLDRFRHVAGTCSLTRPQSNRVLAASGTVNLSSSQSLASSSIQ